MAVDPRTAATHRWMGQPLSTFEDAELRLILAALEQAAYGEAVSYDRLDRCELLEAVCHVDVHLERRRPLAPRSARLAAAAMSSVKVAA